MLNRLFRFTGYLALAGFIAILLLFYLQKAGYGQIKLWLTCLTIAVAAFVFVQCTRNQRKPLPTLFRAIGWFVLLAALAGVLMIYEWIPAHKGWTVVNSVFVAGLFAAQLAILFELKRSHDFFRFLHILFTVVAFGVTVAVVCASPIPAWLLFPALVLNFCTASLVLFTGKK